MLACPRAGVPNNPRGHAGVSAAGHHHTTDTACGNRHLGIAHEGEILRDRQALHARMSACRCVQQAAKPDPCEGRLQTSHDRRCMCQPTSRQCRPSGRDPTRPATLRACMSACSCAQQAAGPDPCEGRMPTSHGRLAHGVLADTPCANRPMRHERGDPTRSASPAHKSNICTTPAARLPGGRAMYIRTIGLPVNRERATHTRLTRFARGVGARVPCDRATVQPTVQSATTAGAVTPGGSTPTWAMYIRTIGLTRERATHTRLTRFARGVGARVP
jgi:hypothetical protein